MHPPLPAGFGPPPPGSEPPLLEEDEPLIEISDPQEAKVTLKPIWGMNMNLIIFRDECMGNIEYESKSQDLRICSLGFGQFWAKNYRVAI